VAGAGWIVGLEVTMMRGAKRKENCTNLRTDADDLWMA
jgi:hypothetical protein